MIRIINGPVERIVAPEDLKKWMLAGYRPVDPLPDHLTEEPLNEDPEPYSEVLEPPNIPDIPDNLEKMKLKDLRQLADQIGVQGYQNMDKATLIAVIQNH